MPHGLQSATALLGRLLLCVIFFESAYGKLTGWEHTRQAMEARGMPATQIGLHVAVVAELAGGLALLLGFRARLGAVLLLAFLIPATLYFHNFWIYAPDQARGQMIHFLKNLAIMGGLLTLAAHGPGGWSLDARRQSKSGKPKSEIDGTGGSP
jgi:putative oxidoreductase